MTGPAPACVHYTRQVALHDQARALVEFDMGSIRQMIAARRDPAPTLWIVEPRGYEIDGHALRDHESIRLIAYVADSEVIYATDGCNSCWHTPEIRIDQASPDQIDSFARRTQLPAEMLGLLSDLVRGRERGFRPAAS